MAADNDPSELALRVNTLFADPATVAATFRPLPTDPALPETLVRRRPVRPARLEPWRSGAILAQSRAAMLVARALDPKPGERVLDLCAAPGGKSTHLAALMADEGEVLAVERNPARAAALQETARRLHASSVRVDLADAASTRREGAVFDRVLVDPPCSGLGTLQSRPDLRWRITPSMCRRWRPSRRRSLPRVPPRSVRAACWSTPRARSHPGERATDRTIPCTRTPTSSSMTLRTTSQPTPIHEHPSSS